MPNYFYDNEHTCHLDKSHIDSHSFHSCAETYGIPTIQIANPDLEEIFPRMGFHENHIARSLAIVDNLDEVLLMHQGMIYPLQANQRKTMRLRVNELDNTDSPIFKNPDPQHDDYLYY